MDARFAAADLKMEQRFAALDAQFARFEATTDRRFDEQIRLMIVLWMATVIPLGGLMLGLFSTLP